MPKCPRCGAAVEPGQDACPACRHYQQEVPRQSAPDLPPPSATPEPSLLPLEQIRRKIRRGQFFRDDVQDAARTGLVGLVVGFIVSVVAGAVALLHAAPGPTFTEKVAVELPDGKVALFHATYGPGSSFETFVTALPIAFTYGIVGSLAFGIVGYVVALLYITIVRPIIAATFWSVERFEREYGDRRVQSLRHQSPTRKVNDD